MAFEDAVNGNGTDFDPRIATESLMRQQAADLPPGSPLDIRMLNTRLGRKLAEPSAPVELPATEPEEADKGPLDFSAQAAPPPPDNTTVDTSLDFSGQAKPAVPTPTAPDLGAWGQTKALAKGVPHGAIEHAGAILQGGAALYDNGVPAQAETPQYDAMGNPTGMVNPATAAVPAKPLEDRTLFKAGKAVKDAAQTIAPMSEQEKDSIGGRVGTGIGAIAPYAAATLLGGPELGIAAGFTGMAASTYGDVYDAAKKAGKSEDDAKRLAGDSALTAGILGSLPLGAGKLAKGLVSKIAASGVAFTSLGEAQEYVLQQIAKEYNPKAGYTPEAKRIIASLITGGVMGGLHHIGERGHATDAADAAAAAEAPSGLGGPPPGEGPTGAGPESGGPSGGPEAAARGPASEEAKAGVGREKLEKILRYYGYSDADIAAMSHAEMHAAVLKETQGGSGAKPSEETEPTKAKARGGLSAEDVETLQRAGWSEEQIDGYAKTHTSPPPRDKAPPRAEDADYSILRAAGWAHEDIETMGAKQRAYEAKQARADGVDATEAAAKYPRPASEPDAAAKPTETAGTRDEPIKAASADDVLKAQPAEPTPAQATAENYKHAHVDLEQFGLTGKNNISVETGVGGVRRGEGPDGKPWEVTLEHAAYGRIKGTKGADGQPLDIFIGPHPSSPHIFVLDQHHPEGGFDEHKILAGFRTPIDAMHAYAHSYTDKAEGRIGHVTAMGPEEFKAWLKTDTTKALGPEKKPVSARLDDAETGSGPLTEAAPAGDVPKEAPQATGADKPSAASKPTTFKTAKGSSYEVHEDGTTTRNKAARNDVGHEGDSGPKERSLKTVYLTDEQASRLAPPQGKWAMFDHGNGMLSTITPGKEPNTWGASPTQRGVSYSDTPAKGLIPLELWKNDAEVGQDKKAYSKAHFGNKIVEIGTAAEKPAAPKAAPRSDEPTNLLQFIAANGGVRPDGDLRAMDAHTHRVQIPGRKGFFGLTKADGHSPDVMRRMAQEAGFFRADAPDAPPTSSVREFYNAIEDGLRGNHTLSEEELGKETKRAAASRAESSAAARDKALTEAHSDIKAEYPDATDDLAEAAAKIMVDEGQKDIDIAVERAAIRQVAEGDYGVTDAEIKATFGEGVTDAIRAEPASEDGKPTAQEGRESARPEAGEEASGDGERVPEPRAEVVQEEPKALTRLEQTVARGRAAADKINTREAAREKEAFARLEDEQAVSRKMEDAIDKIEEGIEAKDRPATLEAARDARRVLAETPQAHKDKDAEYWSQFEPLIKKMLKPGYVTAKQESLIDRAHERGAEAFAEGKQPASAQDAGFKEILSEASASGQILPVLEAWSKGWHAANLAEPVTERTEAGEQAVIPGAEKIGDGELAQRKTDEGLKAKVAQKPADAGLFGDERNQTDLLDLTAKSDLRTLHDNPPAQKLVRDMRVIEHVLGAEAEKVAQVDIARAAEIMAEHPDMPPETAFGQAVIKNAVEQGFVTREQAEEAYGKEVNSILESEREGPSGDGAHPEQSGTASGEVSASGATQTGVVSEGREAGEAAKPSEDSALRAAAEPETAEQPAASGVRATGDEASNTAENGATAKDAKHTAVGKNPAGQELFEDKRGVRSRVENGIRISEPVGLRPVRGGGMEIEIGRRSDEWQTVDEAAPTWAQVLAALPKDKEGHKDTDMAARLMFEITGTRHPSFSDLNSEQRIELLKQVEGAKNPPAKDDSNGVSDSVRASDASASAADVQAPDTLGRTGSVRAEEGRGSEPDVRGTDEGRTEGTGRVSEGAGSERSRGSGKSGADRVSGERADDTPDRRTKRDVEQAAGRVEGENYSIAQGALDEGRSFKVKATDNIRAIELMRQIEAEDRPATRAEQEQLAKYVGWGGIKGAFPDGDGKFGAGFDDIGKRVSELLDKTEYDTARRSIQYAHYTSEDIVRSMWSAVQKLGFKEGQVFEPGMGVGNFAGMMPGDVAANSHYMGLELDHTTARIAKLLYPKYGVRRDDFTKAPLPENAYDLVIGNPPFADVSIKSDPKYAKQGFLLHDYFFAKSLDAVRPGGLLAFVTSAGTMNKVGTEAREYLADRADLVGAIRLPGDAFKKNAGTEVTTDIIFLRKRLPTDPMGDRTWIETVEKQLPNRTGEIIGGDVNRYFAEHPEMVLGEEGYFDKLYENRYGVRAPKDFDIKTALDAAVAKLPSDVMSDWQADNAHQHEQDFETVEKKEGTFYVGPDGALHQMQSGIGKPVERRGKGVEGGRSEADIARIKGLVPVRDSLRAVYSADLAGDTAAADKARAALNKHYDAFVEKFGPINKSVIQTRRPTVIQQESARMEAREEARYAGLPFREGDFDARPMIEAGASLSAIARARNEAREAAKLANRPFDEGQFDIEEIPDTIIDKRPNVDPFMDDPESYRLRAIERYDEGTNTGYKSPVFSENIITREKKPEINSINDALLYSLSQKGRVDIPAMAELSGKTESQVLDELGEQVFKQPGTNDVYQTRDEYLSGDVRKKLAIAEAAAEKNPDFRRNVAALESAQPMPLAPSQIHAQLGMPWIPAETVAKFASEELGLEKISIKYQPFLAQWFVSGDTDSVAASTTWGTADRRAPALISDALNRQNTKIYDTYRVDGREQRSLNVEKTQAAQDKVTAIREKFADWIWKDTDRADQLAGFYNEKFNNLVVRQYDGSYLTTPGIASNWKWRPHQTRGIARIIQSGNTYLAHAVGAGKTSEFIGAVMEMRRLGLVRKPMITVPNHMLAQFTKEFYEQYPTARLAVADERRFHTDRRKQFIANVATEDLDAVIITHSAFGMIPVSDTFHDGIIQQEIAQYRELLAQVGKNSESRVTRSKIENQIERLEQRLVGRGNKKRDQVFTFEEMGIDHLSVDEAHLFRKLDFSTQMSSLKGVSPEGSGMAWDLYVKSQYLDSIRPGHGGLVLVGTPVTNTMAELFTVSRYLQPQVLAERGLEKFDAWAGAFGESVSELEQDAAGNYKPVSRFAKFVNVAELSAMVRQVMDVVTSKQLEQYVVRPQIKGGKRQMNLAEKGPALEAFQQGLAERMKAIENRKGKVQKGDDIMLSVINDGRHAAIDLRLVGLENDPDHPSKLDLMIDNMHRIWKETKRQPFHKPSKDGGYEKAVAMSGPATQMAFINLGLSGKRGFSVPDYIRAELVRRGVPKDEIAYIYDYPTSVAKQRLFNDMNEGKKRILLGSTAKMATGVNAQRRLYAVHNMDPLWFPADDEQRNGRALRQGNMNPEIEINDYSTKGTYDSTMWGMMAKKARFIQGFFEGDPTLREMEDLGEASQYEQAKALTTNDPRLIKLTEIKQDLERANRRKAAFDNEKYALRQRRVREKAQAEHYATRVEETKKDIAQRVETAGDKFSGKVGKDVFDKRAEFGEALYDKLGSLEKTASLGGAVKVADVGGFPVYATVRKGNLLGTQVDVFLSMNGGKERDVTYNLSSIGTVRSIESALHSLDHDLAEYKQRQAAAEKFLAESANKGSDVFQGDAEIERLTGEVRALEAELATKVDPVPEGTTENQAGQEEGLAALADMTPAGRAKSSEVEHLLQAIVQHLVGDHAKLETSKDLIPLGGTNAAAKWGDMAAAVPGARGMYYPWRHLIRLALTEGVDSAAFHEAYHAIEYQLQTPQERALMQRETERLREYVAKSRPRYSKEQIAGLADEEIRAIAFEDYATARSKGEPDPGRGMHIGVRKWFARLWEALQRLANGLRGLGFKTYKDIFESAYRGDYAKRDGSTPRKEAVPPEGWDEPTLASISEVGNRVAKRLNIDPTELRVQIQDRFLRVKKAEESVGLGLDTRMSAYQAESLYYGRTGEQLERLEQDHLDPMIEDMKTRDISLSDMNDYLYAKHAPERNLAMDEINHPELQVGGRDLRGKGSGMSDAEAAAIIERIRASGKLADYEAVERRARQIIDDTRQTLVESGLISQDVADAWAAKYENYVPLRGFHEGTGDEINSGRGKGFDTRGAETKRAFGRLSKAAGPLPYIMMQAEMAIVRAEKNRVGNTFLKFVRNHPDPSRWTIDTAPTKKAIDNRTGLVTTIEDANWRNRDDVFVTKVGGRAVLIHMPSEEGKKLVRALKNMGSSNIGTLMKVMHTLTSTMSRLATQWNPNFTVPNLVRDVGEALINLQAEARAGFVKAFAGHLPGSLKGAFDALRGVQGGRYADAFREFDKAGGRIRFFGIDNPTDVDANIRSKLRKLEGGTLNNIRAAGEAAAHGFEIINGSIENATRLAAYMAARDVGMSIPDSASLARELTVNFNRKGELGTAINSLYMFANAAAQGTARMGKSLQSRRVQKAVLALAAIGAMGAAYNIKAGGEDDAGQSYYMKIPSWIRDKHMIVMWPKGYGHDGQYAKIPLPYGFSPFHVLGDHLTAVMMGQEPVSKAIWAILGSFADAFNPLGEESASMFSFIPSVGRPVAHIQANKNWNGNALYPDDKDSKNVPDSQKSFRNTSEVAKAIAHGANKLTGGSAYQAGAADWHPGSVDHILESLTGGLGKFVKDVVTTGGAIYRGDPFDATKAPIIRRFVGSANDRDSDNAAYYQMRKEARDNGADPIKNAQKDLARGNNVGEATEFLNNNQNSVRGEQLFKQADNQMKALRERENRITNDSAISTDEKQAQLLGVRNQMRDVQNRARKQYMDMKKPKDQQQGQGQ